VPQCSRGEADSSRAPPPSRCRHRGVPAPQRQARGRPRDIRFPWRRRSRPPSSLPHDAFPNYRSEHASCTRSSTSSRPSSGATPTSLAASRSSPHATGPRARTPQGPGLGSERAPSLTRWCAGIARRARAPAILLLGTNLVSNQEDFSRPRRRMPVADRGRGRPLKAWTSCTARWTPSTSSSARATARA
jgi:hypothetical protein